MSTRQLRDEHTPTPDPHIAAIAQRLTHIQCVVLVTAIVADGTGVPWRPVTERLHAVATALTRLDLLQAPDFHVTGLGRAVHHHLLAMSRREM